MIGVTFESHDLSGNHVSPTLQANNQKLFQQGLPQGHMGICSVLLYVSVKQREKMQLIYLIPIY